jgi:hypothetical protein
MMEQGIYNFQALSVSKDQLGQGRAAIRMEDVGGTIDASIGADGESR